MKKKNGFTLVELIAAITILGVLLLIGSQVVMDTMNKNKAKVVYTSIENIAKEASILFLNEPEILEKTDTDEFDKAISYNKNDYKIAWSKHSRIICIDLNQSGKFKKIKMKYFIDVKNKDRVYCSHDVGGKSVVFFDKRELTLSNPDDMSSIKTFEHEKRSDDYIFYVSGFNCNDELKFGSETNNCNPKADDTPVGEYERGLCKEDLENLSKLRLSSICKVFVTGDEYRKYAE